MIYYFSGTGNSEWAAKTLAQQTNDRVTRITKQTMRPVSVGKNDVFGLVFPIYAWSLPQMVSDFLKDVSIEHGAYCYAVCTCGAQAGYAMRILRARMPLDGVWSLIMPDNYIVAYKVEDDDAALAKVRAANVRLREISAAINARESGCTDVQVGRFPFVKTFIGGRLFNKYARSSKPFRSSYDCTGCGLCAKVCPTQNILVAEDMPFWNDDCQQCLACIHRCPKKAIEYGRSTEKHGRYVFHFTKEQIEEGSDGEV
ncbi:MAG: 4Fe-4S dicluster domain-containing protein [Clostridia bacterium]|nr:4Fe-4S dicluster domain-containing protein [Clostridia bacterium]